MEEKLEKKVILVLEVGDEEVTANVRTVPTDRGFTEWPEALIKKADTIVLAILGSTALLHAPEGLIGTRLYRLPTKDGWKPLVPPGPKHRTQFER